MSEQPTENRASVTVRVPTTLTIRDIIVIITAVVSLVLAWGVYGTRLTLVEEIVQDIKREQERRRDILERQKERDAAQDQHILELKIEVDHLKKRK